jgi:hypothetical protein
MFMTRRARNAYATRYRLLFDATVIFLPISANMAMNFSQKWELDSRYLTAERPYNMNGSG